MKKLSLMFLAASAAMLTSCNNDDQPQMPGMDGRIIPTYTLEAMASRADADVQSSAIVSGQKVGFFVTTADEETLLYGNVPYVADGKGAFSAGATAMYWPTAGNINVYAYVPFDSSVNSTTANIFTVSTDQSSTEGYLASDLIMAAPNTNIAKTDNGQVEMNFDHKLAKLIFEISPASSEITLDGGTIKILGVSTSCLMDVLTASVSTNPSAQTDDITVSALPTGVTMTNPASCAAIVVPQVVNAGSPLFQIEVGTGEGMKRYVYSPTVAQTYESGYQYTYKVSVTTSGASVVLTSTLNNWADGGTSNIDMTETVIEREPAIGDWYLADGTFVSGVDAAPSNAIGIVVSLDAPGSYKAYVSSFEDTKNAKWAAADNALLNTAISTNFVTSTAECADALNGLELTNLIKADAAYADYLAFSGALAAAAYSDGGKYAAPSTSSGWFVPSVGEMMMVLEYFVGSDEWNLGSSATLGDGYTLDQKYIDVTDGIDNAFPVTGATYWTISETDASKVWVCIPNEGKASQIKSNSKTTNNGCRTHLILLAK